MSLTVVFLQAEHCTAQRHNGQHNPRAILAALNDTPVLSHKNFSSLVYITNTTSIPKCVAVTKQNLATWQCLQPSVPLFPLFAARSANLIRLNLIALIITEGNQSWRSLKRIQISRASCCFHPRVPTFPSVPYLQIPLVCLPLISTTKVLVHTKQSVGRTHPVMYPNLHHLPTTDFAYQWPLASDSHFTSQHTLNLWSGHRSTSRPTGAERRRTQTTRRRASTGLRPSVAETMISRFMNID